MKKTALLYTICFSLIGIIDGRIVGGSDSPSGFGKYMASLRSQQFKHLCGAAVISNNWILTAAHCALVMDVDFTIAVIGSPYLFSGGKNYSLEEIIIHEDHSFQTLLNDIALMKTTEYIEFGLNVEPVILPASFTPPGTTLWLTGWGRTKVGGPAAVYLQRISLATIGLEECIRKTAVKKPLWNKQICTLSKVGRGACNGDSGGPLVNGNEIVGIVSWGFPCGIGKPDIYTDVFSYKDWILNKTGME